jgi:hypothetical protein
MMMMMIIIILMTIMTYIPGKMGALPNISASMHPHDQQSMA